MYSSLLPIDRNEHINLIRMGAHAHTAKARIRLAEHMEGGLHTPMTEFPHLLQFQLPVEVLYICPE